MKTVLVTGGNGFIGRHTLPQLLDAGYQVHVTGKSHKPNFIKHERVYYHQCNLFEFQQQRQLFEQIKPSHLLHFAWYAVPGKFWSSRENLNWVKASLDLLENFIDYGGKRVIFAGTCAEYDWSYGYCSENLTPTVPHTLYGTCKNSLRQIFEQYCGQVGISSAWGRIFLLYGSYEKPGRLISSVINSLLNNQPAKCSHGKQIRDFLHVEDVASGFVALLNSEVQGAVNIASGKPVTIKEVVEIISRKLNCMELVELGAIPTSANEPPLLVANTQRLNQEVGFIPKFSLAQGLEATINWYCQKVD